MTRNIKEFFNKKNKKRKFKFRKGSSKSKDRNGGLNSKHKKFRPDALLLGRERKISINGHIWKFNKYDNFDL